MEIFKKFKNFLILILFFYVGIATAASNSGFVYSGRILKPDNTPINSGTLAVTVSVYSPAPSSCLLYQEKFSSIDMTAKQGTFSVTLGLPTPEGTRLDSTGYTFNQVISNAGTTFTGLICAVGTTYAPTASDERVLAASFNDGTAVVSVDNLQIKSVPYAMQANQVSGYGIMNLAKVGGTGSATVFTPLEYDFLKNFAAPAAGSATPCANGEILKMSAGVWACAADATGGAPTDSNFNTKGVVGFDTDAATSGMTYTASGIAKVNMGTGVNQIPQLDAGGKLNASVLPASTGTVTAVSIGTNSDLAMSVATGTSTPVISLTSGTVAGQSLFWDHAATDWKVSGVTYPMAATSVPVNSMLVGNNLVADQVTPLFAPTMPSVLLTETATNRPRWENGSNNTFLKGSAAGVSWSGISASDIPDISGTYWKVGGNATAATQKLGTTSAQAISVVTSDTERMHIKATGEVGIGTSNPIGPLEVYSGANPLVRVNSSGLVTAGGAGFSNSYGFVSEGGISIGAGAIGAGIAGGQINLYNGGSNIASLNTTGLQQRSAGLINWSSNTVSSGAADLGLSRVAAGKMAVGNGTAGDFSATLVTGNVGIGTSAPSETLHVAGGNVRFVDASSRTLLFGAGGVRSNSTITAGSSTDGPAQISAINPDAPARMVFLAKGVAGQTANLTEWQDSAGTALAYVNSGGMIVSTQPIISGSYLATNTGSVISSSSSAERGLFLHGGNSAGTWAATTDAASVTVNGTFTPTSSNAKLVGLNVTPTINQTGTATGDYTGLQVNVIETAATGTNKLLIDAQVDGVSKFKVDNTGKVFGDGSGLTGVSASGVVLSGLTAATGTNTIDNTNYAQTWNWSTAATENPLTVNANALTSGSILTLATSNATVNSTNGLLNVANTGASTSGVLARFQSNSTAGSGLTVLANGSVGIGTAIPSNPLHVVGTSKFATPTNTAGATLTGDGSGMYLIGEAGSGRMDIGSTDSQVNIRVNGANAYTFNSTSFIPNGTTNTLDLGSSANKFKTLHLGSDAYIAGNVGVGTTTPSTTLDVRGTYDGTSTLNLMDNSVNATTSSAKINFNSGGTNTGYIRGKYDNDTFGNGIILGSGAATDVLAIRGSNVGIGKTNPATALDVNGTITATAFSGPLTGTATTATNIAGGAAGQVPFQTAASTTSFDSNFNWDNTNKRLGIGTAAPEAKLHIDGVPATASPTLGSASGAATIIGSHDGLYGLHFGVSGNGDTWIQSQRRDTNTATYNILLNPSGGKVGIGTASPAGQFQINNGAAVIMSAGNGNPNNGIYGNYFTTNNYFATYSAAADALVSNSNNRKVYIDNLRVAMASGVPLQFSPSATDAYTAADVGIQRTSAGLIEINNGTLGTFRDLNLRSLNPSGGNIGIGTTTPTAALHLKAGTDAAGTAPLKLTAGVNLTTPEPGAIEFDGTALTYTDAGNTRRTLATSVAGGYVAKAGDTMTGPLAITYNGGNVQQTITSSATEAQLQLINTAAGGRTYNIASAATGSSQGAGFFIYDGTASAIRLKIDATGNVGVGTATPVRNFEVSHGAANDTYMKINKAGVANYYGLDFNNTATGNLWSIGYQGGAGTSGDELAFRASDGSYKLLIEQNGNVGIGTTSPTEALHLYGTGVGIKLQDPATTGGQKARWGISGDNAVLQSVRANDTIESTPLSVGIPWGSNISIDANGGGNFTVNREMFVSGRLRFTTDNDGGISAPADGTLAFWTDGVERARFNNAGNFGIGTLTPASKLHVAAAPTASANYGLVSLGNAPFDGVTADFFTGNAAGTVLAANAASGYAGDFANFQVAGVTKYKIDSSGNITSSGTTSGTGNISTSGNISTTGTGTITSAGAMMASSGAASTSPTTGSLIVTGGAGISGALNVGSNIIANGNISTAASTAATAGTNQSSPYIYLTANYWDGAASAVDQWSIQNILGAGTNPTSTLQFGHTGSTGAAQYAFMNGNVGIGTTSPLGSGVIKLNVRGTGVGADDYGSLALSSPNNGGNAYVGALDFYGSTNLVSSIRSRITGGGNSARMIFYTANGGTLSPVASFDPAGYLQIGNMGTDDAPTQTKALSLIGSAWMAPARLLNLNNPNTGNNSDSEIGFNSLNASGTNIQVAAIRGVKQSSVAGAEIGEIAFYTRNAGANQESIRINGAGNVGIGTTSPQNKLDVNGSIRIASTNSVKINITDLNSAPSYFYGDPYETNITTNTIGSFGAGHGTPANTAIGSWKMALGGGANVGADWFKIARAPATAGAPAFTDFFFINGSGNVGIGTTSPGFNTQAGRQYLTIQGVSDAGVLEFASRSADSDAANVGVLQYTDVNSINATDKRTAAIVSRLSGATANNRGGYLQFYTKPDNGTLSDRMILTRDGNLGIGTGNATPSYLLDVQSSSDNLFSVIGKGVGYGGTLLSQIYSERNVTGTGGLFKVGSAFAPSTFYVQDSGNVGIGIDSPGYRMHVVKMPTNGDVTTARQLAIGQDSNTLYNMTLGYYYTGSQFAGVLQSRDNNVGTHLLLNPSGGNVGIGTTGPLVKLQVEGPTQGYNTDAGQLIVQVAGTSKRLGIGYDTTVGAGFIQSVNSGTGNTPLLLNANGGNVGIGTTSPDSPLDVEGAIALNGVYNGNETDGSIIMKHTGGTAGTSATVEYYGSGYSMVGPSPNLESLAFRFRGQNDGIGFLHDTVARNISIYNYLNGSANTPMTFKSDGSSKFNGNLGVGGDPTSKLHVVGNTNIVNATANQQALYVQQDGALTGVNSIGADFVFTGANTNNDQGAFRILQSNALSTKPSLYVSQAAAGVDVAHFQSGTGVCTITPNSGINCVSDIRLKENIVEIPDALSKVLQVRGVTFDWKGQSNAHSMGFIAQEIEKVAPELVREAQNGYKQVNYANFVAVLTEAIKEFYAKWTADSAELHAADAKQLRKISSLEEKNALLNTRLMEENALLKTQLDQQAKELNQIKKKLGIK